MSKLEASKKASGAASLDKRSSIIWLRPMIQNPCMASGGTQHDGHHRGSFIKVYPRHLTVCGECPTNVTESHRSRRKSHGDPRTSFLVEHKSGVYPRQFHRDRPSSDQEVRVVGVTGR
jgi:hypothetical protein